MRAGVLTAPKRIEIQEIDKPDIGSRDVLVRLNFCGICTLEQRMYTGQMKFRYPVIPGHEASGVIEEIGEEVPLLREGLEPGILVLEIINQEIRGIADYNRLREDLRDRQKPITLKVKEGGTVRYVALTPRP